MPGRNVGCNPEAHTRNVPWALVMTSGTDGGDTQSHDTWSAGDSSECIRWSELQEFSRPAEKKDCCPFYTGTWPPVSRVTGYPLLACF